MNLTKKTIASLVAIFIGCANSFSQQTQNGESSQGSIQRNDVDKTPVSVNFSQNEKYSSTQAGEIFSRYFGMAAGERFTLSSTTKTKHGTVVEKYQEYLGNYKVEGATYSIMYDREGKATFLNGNGYHSDAVKSQNVPSLKEDAARQLAISAVGAEIYAWQEPGLEKLIKEQKNDTNATYFPKGELVWVEDQSEGSAPRTLRLAYRFSVYAMKPLSNEDIYVDASSGKILFRNSLLHHTDGSGTSLYSGAVTFKTSIVSGTRYMWDSTRGGGIKTYNMAGSTSSGTLISSASSVFPTDVSIDAHWGATKVYDYWLNEQGRNSFNNAGAAINSFVHFGTNYDNAFWSGSEMVYGDGSGLPGGFLPLAALDVCAHEIGHAVCQYTANLAYNRESGAMNEGFSDIWGAVIENYADPHESDSKAKNMWEIGEEIATNPLRRMNTPNTRFQPDTYGGTYWVNVTTTACVTPAEGNDYCGVHTNSGVLNHWFYVLSQGEAGTNDLSNAYSVTGIGVSKAADIAYQTELLLSSASTYSNARTASISAATTLYGGCSAEVAAVTKAWYAVGVGSNWTASGAPATTGTNTVCVSSTTTLSNSSTGGTWSSSNSSVASVGTTGVVSGVAVGTANISYVTGGGCTVSSTVTVSTTPTVSAISGASSMCQGASVSLTDATSGGSWTTSNTAIATVGTSGVVTGVGAGTAKISYTVSNSCGATVATMNVTVLASPAAIGGTATLCESATTTLTNSVSSGTWASSTTAVATVNPTSGVVAGISGGTSVITYTVGGVCFTTKTVTVSSLPTVNAISGSTSVCQGSTITLTNSTSSGVWSSSNTAVATVNSSGVVSGASVGGATISYTVTNGCGSTSATKAVTVNAAADAGTITGASSVCVGSTTTLTNSVSGGTWSSSNSSLATVGSTGVVTGMASGSVTISYSVSATCGTVSTTKSMTINPLPNAGTLTGSTTVCAGGSITLSSSVSGGSWSSGTTSVATVATTGVVTGVTPGTSTIAYTYSNTCGTDVATRVVTVSAVLDAGTIAGATSVCAGSTTTLTNSVSGGSWSSSATSIATVASTGVVTGVAAGNVTISYTVSNGCGTASATKAMTVNPAPNAGTITGASSLCAGSTTALTNGATGGAWSSSNGAVATVGTTGVVTGVTGGNVTISYTVTNGCGTVSATKALTVNPLPNAGTITGRDTVNVDSTITLSNSAGSGVWTSSTTGVATINSSGVVSGLTEGTTTISYTVTNSCGTATATKVVTVVSVAPCVVLSGASAVCIGSTISLSASVTGGTWTSGTTSVATVGSASGVVTGVTNGTSNITYSLPDGCTAIKQVTVGLPAIEGTTNVCIGTTTTLTHPSAGGTWSIASSYVATVDASTGVVTGAHVGTTTVTYTTSPGCYVTAGIYVANIILSVSGSLTTCEGGTSTVSVPGYPGGWWSSDSTSIAAVNGVTGVITGVSAGTVQLTYTYAYCYITTVATVNAIPAAITGGSSVCEGSTLSLACATSGGVWSSSNTARATVDGSGTVTGVGAGTVTISYTLGSGCASTKIVSVGAMPASITGTTTVCVGSTTMLACTTLGGTWSSSATGTADVVSGTATGIASYATISGISAGGAIISYSMPTGCVQTVNVTVAAPPSSIGGTLAICSGGSSTLTSSGGGTWSSSLTTVATIGSATGIVVGGSTTGTATITYRTSSTCYTTAVVTVSTPSAISGPASVCKTYTVTLTHGTGGGTWSSSNTAIATVDATTGVVTGVLAGAVNITYNISTGCYAVKTLQVYNNPSAISGTATMCAGASVSLTGTSGTGTTWSSSNTSVATIGSSSGLVTGVAAGNADITYTATSTGCYTTRTVTVNEAPAAITGSSLICAGSSETYMSTPTGGTWSSTAPTVGSINASTGTATGIAGGGTTIKYLLSSGCFVTRAITVSALPAVISGTALVCVGNSVTLSSTTSGATWSTSAAGTASITATTATTATVTGISSGMANISYTNAAGCSRVAVVTVNAAVADIVGDNIICSAGTITLTDATSGGTWSSNATTKVSIGSSTGIATGGATLGTAIITYRVGAGCFTTKSVTNNAALPAISGATNTCSGDAGAVLMTIAATGGTWSSSNTSVGTVDPTTGLVTGVMIGGANTYVNITYTTSAGCSKTKSILIKPLPLISGLPEISIGGTTTLTSSPASATWSSGSPSVATINATTGLVTGVTSGTTVITCVVSGCANTKAMTVLLELAGRAAGVSEEATASFSLFPNPASGSFSVGTGVAGTFSIYTLDGKLASVSELSAGTSVVSLSSGMAAGTYMCRFNGVDGSVQVVRLIYQP